MDLEGSGAEKSTAGAMTRRGATLYTTPDDVGAVGAGGRHGAGKRDRKRVARQRENLAGNSYGVGEGEGGGEASGVAENPRGDFQVVGGGVESPRGTNIPRVEELPRW